VTRLVLTAYSVVCGAVSKDCDSHPKYRLARLHSPSGSEAVPMKSSIRVVVGVGGDLGGGDGARLYEVTPQKIRATVQLLPQQRNSF
jgi:hypothetical protein